MAKRRNGFWGKMKPVPPKERALFLNALRHMLGLDPIPYLEKQSKHKLRKKGLSDD